MILLKKRIDLHNWLDVQQKARKKIGFVPTMGALHPGHISLITASKKENPITVCSIFVNPTQFNNSTDLEKYPVTIEKDIDMLEEAGCDLLFLPSVLEIYPDGLKATRSYDLGYLETLLEGEFRPGHFQGVCMVVDRLLQLVNPDRLYLGQKDYQQCMVINKLVDLTGKKEKIEVKICPTLREKDGLAMSSRNLRLNETERTTAVIIYRSLLHVKENLKPGDLSTLKKDATKMLEDAGFKVDYLFIGDAGNLSPVQSWDGQQKLVALVAAFLNEVRLIDNLPLN
jgi:pantoate--beta-alanine ligase